MRTAARRGLLALGILAAALALLLVFFDWNLLRGPLGRYVTEKTGREFVIEGDLDVRLGLVPRIVAGGVRFANADWGSTPRMFEAETVDFRLRLAPLLFERRVEIPEVTLSGPTVVLVKGADGRANWVLSRDQRDTRAAPSIGRLQVDRGKLVFRDPQIETDIVSDVSIDAAHSGDKPVGFAARGRYKGLPLDLRGRGGSVFQLAESDRPYPLDITGRVGATSGTVAGTVTGLANFAGADLRLDLKAETLGDLDELVGVTLPDTPPYHLAGRLRREGDVWSLNEFKGRVGDSDLAGDASLDRSQQPPLLRANLVSKLLDFDDLGTLVGAAPGTEPGETASARQKKEAQRRVAQNRLLPDRPLGLDRLQRMNADVRFKGERIRRKAALPIDHLSTRVRVEDGRLWLDPLDFGVAGGQVVSAIQVDPLKEPAQTQARLQFRNLHLAKLFPTLKLTEGSVGTISGRASLGGEGNSLAKILGSADGDLVLAASSGRLSNLLLEVLGIDGAEIVKFLFAGDRNVRLRCAVADFRLQDGVLASQAIVLDTTDTRVNGVGQIDLGEEALDLTFYPEPKDASVLSLRAPIHMRGALRKPDVSPDRTTLAMRGASAAVLAAIAGPLAAIIPLIETGPGEDADCGELLSRAQSPAPAKAGKKPAREPRREPARSRTPRTESAQAER